jgi:uncharacterized protein YbjT (DUF2867 family)
MSKKIIAVVGATGAQGGGLVRAILADKGGEFAVRALTRKPDTDKARELAKAGAELAVANIDDPASLRKAFTGAYGAFCITNYWEHMSAEKEIAQAQAQAQAARDTGLKHVIWSTLEDTRLLVPLTDNRMPTLHGQYKVPHFDTKGSSDRFFTELGVPTTFLLTSFYWDNLISFGMGPKPGPDGKLTFTLPMADKPMSGIAAEDIGKCAYGIFKLGTELIGKRVGIAGEHLTGQQMAQQLSRALGKDVVYNYVPPEVYRTFNFPGADDMGNMFQYYRDFAREFTDARQLSFVRSLNPELQTFSQWLERNKARIPLS